MSQKLSQQQCHRTFLNAAVSILLVMHIGASSVALANDPVELGRYLFEHKWTLGDPLSPSGDGLGPMYNADSCVACHSLGGIGGSGEAEHNVSLLSVVVPFKNPSARERTAIRSHAAKIHPAFSGGASAAASVVLHQFSNEPRYERWRQSVLGVNLPAQTDSSRVAVALLAAEQKLTSSPLVAEDSRKNRISSRLTQRNTPALFGAGLIDSIPEKTLLELAKAQAERFPGIEGRVGRTVDGKVGRFGWRGQAATLRDFVLTACSVELGLQNDGHPQAANPLGARKATAGNDLTAEQCDALIAFIASLPAPRHLAAANENETRRINHGAKLFETTGCTACHVRDVGSAKGVFSDLLLHDMGPELEDPIPAFPSREGTGSSASSGNSAYYGGPGDIFAEVPVRLRREWRTPPLWGARDSAPYLHDGRARTLVQAIAAHGGEAESSAKKFAGLDFLERSHLVDYLNSLAAPRSP